MITFPVVEEVVSVVPVVVIETVEIPTAEIVENEAVPVTVNVVPMDIEVPTKRLFPIPIPPTKTTLPDVLEMESATELAKILVAEIVDRLEVPEIVMLLAVTVPIELVPVTDNAVADTTDRVLEPVTIIAPDTPTFPPIFAFLDTPNPPDVKILPEVELVESTTFVLLMTPELVTLNKVVFPVVVNELTVVVASVAF